MQTAALVHQHIGAQVDLQRTVAEGRQLDASRLPDGRVGMRNLFESAEIAALFLDRSMLVRDYTSAVTEHFDLAPHDLGRAIDQIDHRLEGIDLVRDCHEAMMEGKPIERTIKLRDAHVFHLMRVSPYRTSDGEIDGALITFVNITELVAAQEQQRVLVAELNHRVRNMLQVVMGLANQTLHRCADLQQFEAAFVGRMQALARAYDLLSREGWQQVPVAELLRAQLSPFMTEGGRYSGSGDHLVLTPSAALSLGLVTYELATNSMKYGALSRPTGHVGVQWRLQTDAQGSEEFVLQWKETGGPAVKEPTRHGFGSELVERQLKYELNGTATMEFLDTGLVVTLAIPAEEALEPRHSPGAISEYS